MAGLLAVFTAANVAEAVRQDTDSRLAATEALVADVAPRLAAIEEAVAQLDARTQAMATSIEHLLHLVRHPVAGVTDKLRRGLKPNA